MFQRNIPRPFLARAIESQGHCCIYCLLPFGTVISKGTKTIVQTPVADHFVPWAFQPKSVEENAVASCQMCNHIKTDQIFDDIESARRWILKRRKGYRVEYIPNTPSTESPDEWSAEYAAYLSA